MGTELSVEDALALWSLAWPLWDKGVGGIRGTGGMEAPGVMKKAVMTQALPGAPLKVGGPSTPIPALAFTSLGWICRARSGMEREGFPS